MAFAILAVGCSSSSSSSNGDNASSGGSYKMPSASMLPTIAIGQRVTAEPLGSTPVARGDLIVFRHPCEKRQPYVKRAVAISGDTVEIRCNRLYVNGEAVREKLVEGHSCEYIDQIDERKIPHPCSRYRETLGAASYETFHPVERVDREAADPHDFPHQRQLPGCVTQRPQTKDTPAPSPGTIVETRPNAGPCEPQAHFVVPSGSIFTLGDNRSNSNDSRYWGVVPEADVIGRVSP